MHVAYDRGSVLPWRRRDKHFWFFWWRHVNRAPSWNSKNATSPKSFDRFFSRWRQSAILDLFGAYLDHPQRVIGGLFAVQYFVVTDAVVSIIWKFQYLARFACKCLFTPQNCFWQIWPLKWGTISTKLQKAQPCVSLCRLSHASSEKSVERSHL